MNTVVTISANSISALSRVADMNTPSIEISSAAPSRRGCHLPWWRCTHDAAIRTIVSTMVPA